MSESDIDPISELQGLLDTIESFAPIRRQTSETGVIFRLVDADGLVEDSLEGEEEFESQEEQDLTDSEDIGNVPVIDFRPGSCTPVTAVDCGIARLGETDNGLIIALRATIVIWQNNSYHIDLFKSGPIYLHNGHKLETLYELGQHLGKPDFFVELDETDTSNPRPLKVKSGVADDSHQYADRFRNWLERLVQNIAVRSIQNGIILFDGALTLRTRDTPSSYLEHLSNIATQSGNAIIAISKQSLLQIKGRPIRFWLNDVPLRPSYRLLTPLMRQEGINRVLGNAYAVRFSALGPTFRMDVKAARGQSDDEAIGQLLASTFMRGGYPDILVRAHAHSYFTSPDVVQLQAQAGAKYKLKPQTDIDLGGIFAPFGGRFK